MGVMHDLHFHCKCRTLQEPCMTSQSMPVVDSSYLLIQKLYIYIRIKKSCVNIGITYLLGSHRHVNS